MNRAAKKKNLELQRLAAEREAEEAESGATVLWDEVEDFDDMAPPRPVLGPRAAWGTAYRGGD